MKFIYMTSENYQKFKKFCLNNPNKIIIATGDTCQIEPITELSNQKDYDIYANECVNNIFNVDVILKIPKIIKGEEQIKFIANLRIDIFSNTGDVNKPLERKYIIVVGTIVLLPIWLR